MLVFLIGLLYIGLAALAGRWVFERKQRNPLTGTVLGALASLFSPVAVLGFLIVAFILPPATKIGAGSTLSAEEKVNSLVEKLTELEGLRDREVITPEEFQTTKAQILAMGN